MMDSFFKMFFCGERNKIHKYYTQTSLPNSGGSTVNYFVGFTQFYLRLIILNQKSLIKRRANSIVHCAKGIAHKTKSMKRKVH